MRFYSITITDPTTKQPVVPPGFAGLLGGASYTNWVNGKPYPSAWNVEMDLYVNYLHQPMGSSFIRIWGISLQEISQANNLVGKNISVSAGMQAGLPLSNPKFAGLLFTGRIYQAFGNWVNTEMTLDLYFIAGPVTAATAYPKPVNLVVNAQPNQPMAAWLNATLKTAYPDFPVVIDISPNLTRPNAEVGYYGNIGELATYVNKTSRDIVRDPNYSGVCLTLDNSQLSAKDWNSANAVTVAPKQINFQDLIGQPTWIAAGGIIQLKCAMRADLNINDPIVLPKTIVTNTQAAASNLTNQTATFQGGFVIVEEHHLGNFRQPTAEAWVSVFNARPQAFVGQTPALAAA